MTQFFGRPAMPKFHAELGLRGRSQRNSESFTSYIEDEIGLCRRVDARMTEADRIKHIMEGIDDDAFRMLVAKHPETVTVMIHLCQTGQGEKGNNLELIPDAFDNDQEVLACENSDVTVSTARPEKTEPMTAARRKATVSRRQRSATVVFASRKSAIKARKVGRAAPRRRRRLLKSTTRKRSVRSSTSRQLKITTRKKKRQHTAAAKARRHGTGSFAMREHVTTKKGQRSSVTTEAPDSSITEQR
ncbi:uncharacterized protein LOC119186316 [Rhipicephalus microplus]|uniref:uncharacterized protein LOC119186316 n=1 Tax=Rhipicephalus microplus TaxID=6941 RepID=UPI003F6C4CF2